MTFKFVQSQLVAYQRLAANRGQPSPWLTANALGGAIITLTLLARGRYMALVAEIVLFAETQDSLRIINHSMLRACF